jgi:hypothetical protein
VRHGVAVVAPHIFGLGSGVIDARFAIEVEVGGVHVEHSRQPLLQRYDTMSSGTIASTLAQPLLSDHGNVAGSRAPS